jgi:hypothetical protein
MESPQTGPFGGAGLDFQESNARLGVGRNCSFYDEAIPSFPFHLHWIILKQVPNITWWICRYLRIHLLKPLISPKPSGLTTSL